MNTTAEKTAVLCFATTQEIARQIEKLRTRKDGSIVSRSEVIGEIVEIGLKRLEEVATLAANFRDKTDVERETSFPAYPTTVPSVTARSSKRSMGRSTRKSAGTADSK